MSTGSEVHASNTLAVIVLINDYMHSLQGGSCVDTKHDVRNGAVVFVHAIVWHDMEMCRVGADCCGCCLLI